MASGFSSTYANAMLNHILGGASRPSFPAMPNSTWVAAFTNVNASSFLKSNDMASALEVSTTLSGYGRVQIMDGTSITFDDASSGVAAQSSDIVWATASANWGIIYAVALITASSGGSVFAYADLDNPRTINIGDTLRVPVGQFMVGL